MRIFITGILVAFALGFYGADSNAVETRQDDMFVPNQEDLMNSLHGTAGGMRYFFEREDGMGPLTGINYDDLGCKNCHVPEEDSCATCHDTNLEESIESCEACHGRRVKTRALGISDVHAIDNNMLCWDCHSSEEIHGDGTELNSMLEPSPFDIECSDCHNDLSSSYAHDVHTSSLECQACHVETVITCYNCHFDTMVNEGVKKPHGVQKDFVLLVNDERSGKINTGSYQSVYYQGQSFVIFAPFNGHSVSPNARSCEDCHANDNVQHFMENGSVELTTWEGDSLNHRNGAIPLVGDMQLKYLDYDGETDTWSLAKETTDQVQYGFCEPLTSEQLEKMAMPMQEDGSGVENWPEYK